MKITESPECQQKKPNKNGGKWHDNFMHKLVLSQYFGRFFGELHLIQTVTCIRFLYKLNGNLTKKITFISLSNPVHMLLWQTCILKIIIVCSIAMTSPEHSTHQQVQVGFPQSHTASNGRPNDPPGNWGATEIWL